MRALKAYSILAALLFATIVTIVYIRSHKEPEFAGSILSEETVQDKESLEKARLLDTTFTLLSGEYFGRQILDTIAAKTGARFTYSSNEINDSSHFFIKGNLVKVGIEAALKVIFTNKRIHWHFYGAEIQLVRTDLYH